jgi:hypothetical protein
MYLLNHQSDNIADPVVCLWYLNIYILSIGVMDAFNCQRSIVIYLSQVVTLPLASVDNLFSFSFTATKEKNRKKKKRGAMQGLNYFRANFLNKWLIIVLYRRQKKKLNTANQPK